MMKEKADICAKYCKKCEENLKKCLTNRGKFSIIIVASIGSASPGYYCYAPNVLTITGGKKYLVDRFKEEIHLNTFMANAQNIERKWYVVDADGMVLGRLASQVANILRGKNKPIYTPHVDTGDHVIIINASKIVLTGKKLDQKIYYHHSGYVGGLKETKYRKLIAEKPEFAVRHAIVGMLPKGPLGRQMATKLRVYAGPEHEQAAQKPEKLELIK